MRGRLAASGRWLVASAVRARVFISHTGGDVAGEKMVSTRGKKTGNGNPPPSPPKEAAEPRENINSAEEPPSKEESVSSPPRDNQPALKTGETPVTEGQGADHPSGTPVSGGAAREGHPELPEAVKGDDAGEALVPKTEEAEEGKEASQEAIKESPSGGEKPAGRPAGETPGDANTGGGAVGDESIPAEKAATNSPPGNAESSIGKPGSKQQQQQQQPSGAAKERQHDGPARELGGDAMDVAEEPTLVGEVDSSDGEDEDDGFKVVVGKEVAPAVTPVVPTKRFLRGTNTLVNNNTSGTTGAKESGSSTASSKPASAAAGIASLVPSKGAPVATARPSLRPGEYPPTAELQQSAGRTAFDVDIDGMEEQPWRHPGVDIADFFNYGFTEDSWRVYCEKQLRNRYDRTRGRSKTTNSTGGRGGGNTGGSSSHMRHGAGDRPNSLQPPRPPQPSQMHTNNGPPGPNSFRPLGPAGNNGGAWGGGSAGPERFPPGGFASGPPGHGNVSPPWFEGQPPQQQQQQQQQMQLQMPQQQMHPQNRQHFGPGAGPGGSGAMGGGAGNMNNGRVDPAGMRRSRSPDPRDGPLENKMPRLR